MQEGEALLIRRLRILNFRSIRQADIELGKTTILIGSNNAGKSAVLEAIRIALTRRWGQRGTGFTEYDVHLCESRPDPKVGDPVVIEVELQETIAGEWPENLQTELADIMQLNPISGQASIIMRVSCAWDAAEESFIPRWEFLNVDRNPLAGRGARAINLQEFFQFLPVFYLEALRDAGDEFSARSQFWGRLLRTVRIPEALEKRIKRIFDLVNHKLLNADPLLNNLAMRVLRFVSEEIEAMGIAQGIAKIGRNGWGEVAVIARTRALLEKIQAALIKEHVNSVIAQRRDDFRSPQFLWLNAVLRQALRPLDRRALETLTGAFNRWFETETRVEDLLAAADLTSRPYLDEWAASVKTSHLEETVELADMAARFGREPSRFRSFIESVIDRLPADQDVTSDIAEDRAAWADLTRNIAKAIGRDAPLEQFLQELAIRSKEPPIDANTVALMTIHAAKGKEFDHVYLVGLAEDVLPSFQSLKAGEKSAEMEEERRNCFVAITRAREWLCLSYADSYRGWQKQPSRFLKEMGMELPTAPIV